jgi:hypothetical protein
MPIPVWKRRTQWLLFLLLPFALLGGLSARGCGDGIRANAGPRYQPQCLGPMYAEKSLAVIQAANKARFRKAIEGRLTGLEKESQKKRVLKVLKQIGA